MRLAALSLSVLLLAGCNVHSKNPANDNGTVTINASDSGQVEFNLPFVSGSVKLPEGMMNNADFRTEGAKEVPGGKGARGSAGAGGRTKAERARRL